MKFSELREADLSKAQIKKVHDKADDLPKNDFIKRYGKDGDAVRFATATNIVKKQLGIGEGFKIDAQRKAAFASGYKEKGKKKEEVEEGGPGSGPQHKDITITRDGKTKTVKGAALSVWKKAGWVKEELDDKDKETIKPIIKQLQKSVKAHGKQAKQLQKDIKDEVVTEAVSDAYVKQIARMTDRNDHFGARIELARMMKDKELMKMYDSLEKMHNMNLGGNDALTLRSKLDKNLKFRLTQKFKTDANKLMDAL